MTELVARFFIGGAVVSLFAVLGDIFRPKTFGGLFAAAPSVALSTLALTVMSDGPSHAATEARSMLAGAVALFAYSQLTAWLLIRQKCSSLVAAMSALPVWLVVAFALWGAFLR